MENLFETLAEITRPAGLLDSYKSKAIQAHNWTSHVPEKRGEQLINDYNNQLSEDIIELERKGIDSEAIESYKARYINLFTSWLSSKGNCTSSFITGPSNYNIRRHGKTRRSEEKHYTLWQVWRTRSKKAIIRNAQPEKTFISEIDRYKSELAGMQKNQEIIKACNAVIKKSKGRDCTAGLIAVGLSEVNAKKVQLPDFAGIKGFPSFSLTNNNANIKRVELRIKELEKKESLKNKQPITEYRFEKGKLIVNYEADRLQIIFDTKPTVEELTVWKNKGLNSYNWSPSVNAWQRKITSNALWCLKRMLPQLTKIN